MNLTIEHTQTGFHPLSEYNWITISKAPSKVIDDCSDIVNAIERDSSSFQQMNHQLFGQLEREYQILYKDSFVDFLTETIVKHEKDIKQNTFSDINHFDFTNFKFADQYTYLDPKNKVEPHNGWVNFQKKYEYNPPHVHGGHFSFIYYHKVPYTRESELAATPSPNASGTPPNGATGFVHGTQRLESSYPEMSPVNGVVSFLSVSKQWEGMLVVFPAYLVHLVNPFYSSDEYRITMSGNILFKKPNTLL